MRPKVGKVITALLLINVSRDGSLIYFDHDQEKFHIKSLYESLQCLPRKQQNENDHMIT